MTTLTAPVTLYRKLVNTNIAVQALSVEARFTPCNMAVKAGARADCA